MRRIQLTCILVLLMLAACAKTGPSLPVDQVEPVVVQPGQASTPALDVTSAGPVAVLPTTTPIPLPPTGDWRILPRTAQEIEQLYSKRLSPFGAVYNILWSPDGSILAVSGKTGVVLLDGETLELQRELPSAAQSVSLSFSSDGRYLAASGFQSTVQVWDLDSGKMLQIIRDAGEEVYFAPDGKTIAVSQEAYEIFDINQPVTTIIKLFDVDSGRLLKTLTSKTLIPVWPSAFLPETIGVFFSGDGTKLQAVNLLGDVRIWDVPSGNLLNTSVNTYTRERLSNGLCYTDATRGNQFVLGCHIAYLDPPCIEQTPGCDPVGKTRYEFGIWDTARINRIKNHLIPDAPGSFLNLVYDPQSSKVGLLYMGEIAFWNLQNAKAAEKIIANEDVSAWTDRLKTCRGCAVPNLAFKPGSDGNILAVAYEGTLELWDVQSETKLQSLTTDTRLINAAALGEKDGQTVLAAGLSDGRLMLVSLLDNVLLHEDQAHAETIQHMAFSSGGEVLLTAGSDRIIKSWDANRMETVREYPFEPALGMYSPVYKFAAHPGTNLLAMSSRDQDSRNRSLTLYEVTSGSPRLQIDTTAGHSALSQDGKWLATGEKSVVLWDAASGEMLREFTFPQTGELMDIAISPDGGFVAASQEDDFLVWNVNSGEAFPQPAAGQYVPVSLAFSPTGCLLAMGDRAGVLSLLDLDTRQIIYQWQVHQGNVKYLEFSQDGRLLLSTGADGIVHIWGQPGALQLPAGENSAKVCSLAAVPVKPTPVTPTSTFTAAPPTATPTLVAFYRSLSLTDPLVVGNDVREMQQRLFALGYVEVGTPDGVFGNMTDQAVRLFQERNSLVVDGIVGPITWNLLFSEAALRR